ncbi:MAG: hypothetical protein JWP32_1049, partial [Schumannella sp.]|nr:hypothetical protein [Schumannella sp.]
FSERSADSDDDAKTFRLRLGAMQVVVNLGTGDWHAGAGRMLLATSPRVRVSAAGVVLPPDTAAVLRTPDVESLNIG